MANAKDGALFVNVSRDATPEEFENCEALIDANYPESAREWGDMSDYTKPVPWQ